MEYRTLGKNGPKVSRIGLGCNNFGGRLDLEGTRKVVDKALDLGITFFDTSDSYGTGGSEKFLGQTLGKRRGDIVLATKFGWPMDKEGKLKGASRAYIMYAVEASLKRMQTDYIDLYQLHVPDPLTPIEETLRALDDLVRQGKVRYIGCTQQSAQQLDEALQTSKKLGLSAFVSGQNEYNLLERKIERELVPTIEKHGVGFIPFAPLGGGMLTGKYRANAPLPADARLSNSEKPPRQFNDANWRIVEELRAFCDKRGHTMVELAMSWLIAQPFLSSIIAGAMSPEQVEQNVRASEWALTPADMAEVDRITRK